MNHEAATQTALNILRGHLYKPTEPTKPCTFANMNAYEEMESYTQAKNCYDNLKAAYDYDRKLIGILTGKVAMCDHQHAPITSNGLCRRCETCQTNFEL